MITTKDVTVIIPHLGATVESEYALDQCLQSLKETVPSILVMVSRNNSRDKICHHKNSEVDLQGQGQCKAVNAAVATTNTSWILITNDDMIYAPSWWEKLTNFNDSSIACISPKLVEPRLGAPTFEVYFCGGAGGDFDKQKWLDFALKYKGEGIRTGFNLPFLIKRDLWDMIGGYDINYDPWGSNGDSDLEYKIKLAGVQPMQNTDSVVYHFSQTSGTFLPENNSYWQKNFAYFTEKWGFPRTDDGIWEATFDIPKPPLRKFTPTWEGKYG